METDAAWLENEDSGDEQQQEQEIEQDEETEQMVINPTSVRERIDADLAVLSDFANRANKGEARSDVLARLSASLTEYYGYIPDLVNLFLDLFSPAECVEYMDASDRPRPLVIRANTLKVTRKDLMETLSKRGVNLEAIEWSKVAVKVTESTIPIGATPEYLAGHYMLQAAASLNPVMALQPRPGERVLDMSSAPGGKTSYIAQLMKNSGTVVANDLKPQRQKATVANLHRMGVKNAIICCYDGRKIPKIMKGFDRVLLDAPCSGLGIISRDQSVKLQRSFKDVQRLAHLQKELLLAAIDATNPDSKTGGVIVYSTCSISNEENEQVVQYALQKRHVRLVDTGLAVGRPGYTRYKERRFHPSLNLTRRFYPHVHNMDGFYVAKFKKYANGPRGGVLGEESDEEAPEEEEWDSEEEQDMEQGEEVEESSDAMEQSSDEEEPVPVVRKKKTTAAFAHTEQKITTSKAKKNGKEKSPTNKNTNSNKAKGKPVEKDSPKAVIPVKEVQVEAVPATGKKRSRLPEPEVEETPKKSAVKVQKEKKVKNNVEIKKDAEEVVEEVFSPAFRASTPTSVKKKSKKNSIQSLRSASKAVKK
jgi:ribosomal RNA methyltransferase Nop2